MTVPDEAVEAAARALAGVEGIDGWPAQWADEFIGQYRDISARALTAAAPFIAAQAWDAAVQYADDQGCLLYHEAKGIKSHNPYRSGQ